MRIQFSINSFAHLYGRGYSNTPIADYNCELFVQQAAELLFALNITQPITVFGFSLGGGVAVKFTSLYPEKVEKLVLMAPVGIPFKLPFVAK